MHQHARAPAKDTQGAAVHAPPPLPDPEGLCVLGLSAAAGVTAGFGMSTFGVAAGCRWSGCASAVLSTGAGVAEADFGVAPGCGASRCCCAPSASFGGLFELPSLLGLLK